MPRFLGSPTIEQGVGGLTHTRKTDKTEIRGELRLDEHSSFVLDVSVVTFTLRIQWSEWCFSSFPLTALASAGPNRQSPSSNPTSSPSLEPAPAPSCKPTDKPTRVSTSLPGVSSVDPTEYPSLSSSQSPSFRSTPRQPTGAPSSFPSTAPAKNPTPHAASLPIVHPSPGVTPIPSVPRPSLLK